MNARTRSSLLWGLVATLSFLVLLQAYVLAGGEPASVPVAAGVALAVGVAAAGLTHVVARRLHTRPVGARRDPEADPDADGERPARDGPNQRS